MSWWKSLSQETKATSMMNGSDSGLKSPSPLSKEINPSNESPDIQN
jgi:hypothetical protein